MTTIPPNTLGVLSGPDTNGTAANPTAVTGGPIPGVGSQAITDINAQNIVNPAANLPAGALQTATLINPNQNEFMTANQISAQDGSQVNTQDPNLQAQAGTISTTPTAGTSTTVGTGQFGATAATYNASQVNTQQAATAQAAQGQVNAADTVAGQYNNLMNFGPGQIPDWAKGAVAAAQDQANSRGLVNSTINEQATTAAIMQAALPIAQQDASTNFQMNMANLSNSQQANMLNAQQQFSAMMSNQAATNAASQFNAASENQVQQFYDNLSASIQQNNATRMDAMQQYNANLALQADATNANNQTQVSLANAQTASTIDRFNSQMQNTVDQFNANQAQQIQQSNTQWLRTINTANTAAVNAANQANAQNLFNISQTAQANMWQEFRDEASWANTDSQNQLNRSQNLAVAALQSNTAMSLMNQQQQGQLFTLMGQWAGGALNNFLFGTTTS